MFNCSDDRLVRNAISQINDSRIAEGITLSRYPSAHPQEIPPFSLWWVSMVHDYWMYRTDSEFVQSMLPGIRQVISFFERYQQSDGSLSNPPYWEFSDWANGKGWFQGQPPIGKNGNSSILDFQLLLAFQTAADLENKLGNPAIASQYLKSSDLLKNTIKKKYWSDQRQLFADVPEKTLFSQHANVFAVLTGLVSGDSAARLIGAVLKDSSLTQGSIYFKFYLNQAVTKAGLGDNYLNLLDIWKENIALGLTTWAETSDVSISRSDCHAWGCSPNIEFYRIVLGINSCAPEFRKVKIEPHLGRLNYAKGSIPHPNGEIGVSYLFQDEKWTIKISLPKDVSGVFVWKGKTYPLKDGVEQEFRLQ
jgi:alpha-L-rhamnosidase